jgi:hypothetical protein
MNTISQQSSRDGRQPRRMAVLVVIEASTLAVGGVGALARLTLHGRAVAVGTIGFGILGVVAELTFTIQRGDAIDVAYHATLLPLLIVTLGAVWTRLSTHQQTIASVVRCAGP